MPQIILPYGRKWVANRAFDAPGASAYNLQACLFKADIDPTENDSSSLYLAGEADFDGYSRQSVSSFTNAVDDGPRARSFGDPVTFTVQLSPIETNDIYGYFLLDVTTDEVLMAQRFDDAPIAMDASGKTIVAIPAYSERSEFSGP